MSARPTNSLISSRHGPYRFPSPGPQASHLDPNQIASDHAHGIYQLTDYEESILPLRSSVSNGNWPAPEFISERYSQPAPNILSAEYDPFAPFHSDLNAVYEVSANQFHFPDRSTGNSIPPTSPPLSGVDSHRSSVSSAPASETYTRSETYQNFLPRLKMEDHLDWSENNNPEIFRSSHLISSSGTVTTITSFNPSFEATNFHQPQKAGSWEKSRSFEPSEYSESIDQSYCSRPPSAEPRKLFKTAVARTRAPRKMTTREDANFQCKVKGCGKLFSRSYNYKAHMETHDTGRVYPFPCPIADCNKKFVRKTDLQRHHQSVHMKERNYQCDFCTRFFARKDTLRRHMEDGCSKRFDLAVAFNPQHPLSDRTSHDRNREPSSEARPPSLRSQLSSHSQTISP